MYKSIKALEEGEQAVTVYLMYWVVLYFLIIVEQVTNERTTLSPSLRLSQTQTCNLLGMPDARYKSLSYISRK